MASKPDIKFLNLAPKKIGELDVAEWVDHLVSGFQLVLSQSLNTEIAPESVESVSEIKGSEKSIVISVLGPDSKIPGELSNALQNINVLLSPIADAKEEAKVLDSANFEFFSLSDTDGVIILEPTGFRDIGKNYWLKLVDLAFEISKGYSKALDSKKAKVYLAAVNPKDRSVRDEVKRDLQRRGYTVLPKSSLPGDSKKAEAIIKKDLQEANLSIHILGREYGKPVNGTAKSIVDLQNSLAADICKKANPGLQRIVWQSPDDIVKDQQQREFLDDLVKTPEQLTGAEFLKIPIEHLKTLMVDVLSGRGYSVSSLPVVPHMKGTPEPISKESVYVVFDGSDKKWAEEVIGDLKKSGVTVGVSQVLSTVSSSMAYHKECLARCNSVVLLAEKASSQWVVAKMKDFLKAPGFGREADFSSKSFLFSKDHSDLADRAKKEGYQVIEKGPGTETKILKEKLKSTA